MLRVFLFCCADDLRQGFWLQAAILKLLIARLGGELLVRCELSVLCFEGFQELGPIFRKHRGVFSVSFGKGIDLHFGVVHDHSLAPSLQQFGHFSFVL